MLGHFIYCRKSSEAEDRQVLSIESQTRELQQLAARLNLQVTEILTESKSAKEPGRPVFNQMMKRLYDGEAAGIICWKVDRLARNPLDGGSIIWAIKQRGITVITPAQSYARENDNVILMYIEFGMAQKYVDDLSKNVRRGIKTKLENGWYPGIAPPGYLNNTVNLTGENNLIKDPERFPLIRRMWDMMLTGLHSPRQILELATKEWGLRTRKMRTNGNRPFARSAVYKIFTRPFYYGWFEYPKGSDRWYRGKHDPMVTEAEYDRVQALLGQKGNPRPRTSGRFPFTGLISCGECGGKVTAEEKRQLICGNCRFKFAHCRRETCPRCQTPIEAMAQPRFLNYTYYHCSKSKNPQCKEKCLRSSELELQITDFLARIHISDQFQRWAVKYLHELHQQAGLWRIQVVKSQQRQYQECLRRIENLMRLKTSAANSDSSLLSDKEYGQERLKLLREKESLEQALRGTDSGAETCLDQSAQVFQFASTARNRFVQGDSQTKREIIYAVSSNLILKDKKLNIQARIPFLALSESLNPGGPQTIRFEPKKTLLAQGQNGQKRTQCPLGWGERDDIRTFQRKAERVAALIYTHFKKEFGSRSGKDSQSSS